MKNFFKLKKFLNPKSTYGFTLLELLIVIGMTVIVFAFSMPFGLQFYRSQIADETSNNLVDVLRNARQYAVLQKNDSSFGVYLDSTHGNIILFQGPSYSGRNQTYDEVYPFTSGVSLGGLNEIVFSKQTGTPSATGTVDVSYGPVAKAVTIAESGGISVNGDGSVSGSVCTSNSTGASVTTSGLYTVHTFSNSGTFTVTSGHCNVEVFAWGGGGAGGTVGGWSFGSRGGAGGSAYGIMNVSSSSSYIVSVGGAGQVNSYYGATGGGGPSSNNNSDNRYTGGGGGYSGLFGSAISQDQAVIIAGGGGGGGSSRAGTGNAGGAGGGTVGEVGYSPYDGKASYGGNPGTQSAAGADASCSGANTNGGQGALQGGVVRVNSYGGGGGGGYWGGSAGGYSESNTMGGGGGGSGYYNPTYFTTATLTAGSGTTPGDSGNPLRNNAGNAGDVAGAGSPGLVVVRYLTGGGVITGPVSHTITFDSNGGNGSMSVQTITANYSAYLNSNSFTKTGNVFVSWNTLADGTGTNYSNNAAFTMGTANVILYAQWSIAHYVTYNGNTNTSGTAPTDSTAYAANNSVTTLSNNTLAKTGYLFIGWNTVANGSGVNYSIGSTLTMPSSDVTLYAQWAANVCDATCVSLRNGLVAYYPFDSSVNDNSSYVRVGTNNGGVSSAGKVGSSYFFSGSGKYVSYGDSSLPTGDSPRTFSGWFKVTNPDYNDSVGMILYGTQTWGYQSSPIILDGRGGMLNGGAQLKSISWVPYGTTDTAAQKITDTQWHHFVMTYSGNGNDTYYIDGVNSGLQEKQFYGNVNTVLNGELDIGIPAGWPGITGIYLDEVSIWNRALSSTEASQLCNNTGSGCVGRSLVQ